MRGRKGPSELDALVDNLTEHHWFGSLAPFTATEEQTAHVSPGYPWLLAWVSRLTGPAGLDYAMRWTQCGLGTLTAGLYFLFARRAFRHRAVATLAGLLCALHPFWVIDTPTLDDGVLASFLLALVLRWSARAGQVGGPFTSLLYGLALAGTALVRAALLPFALAAVAWFLLRSRRLVSGWLCALVAFLGFAGGLAPWVVRNFQVFGEPVPIVDTAHLHLWVGNNPHANGGPATEAMLASAPGDELAKISKQPERYARLGTLAWQEVRTHPAETLLPLAGRAGVLSRRAPAARRDAGRNHRRGRNAGAAGRVLPGDPPGDPPGFAAPGTAGLARSYGWSWETLPAALAAVWIPLPYLLGHAEALSGPRLPLDGILLCYAAFGASVPHSRRERPALRRRRGQAGHRIPFLIGSIMTRFLTCVPLVLLAVLGGAGPVRAWGDRGHVVAAAVADLRLTDKAKAGIRDLLGERPIADMRLCTWADQIKRSALYKKKYPKNDLWHFVDVPFSAAKFDRDRDGQDGNNVIDAIERVRKVLQNSTDKEDRKEALLFVVHLVADLHQPLHAAERDGDRGGNLVKVTFPGTDDPRLNLHRVWDVNLVDAVLGDLEPADYAKRLHDAITNEEAGRWQKGTAEDWVNESHQAAVDFTYRKADKTELPKEGVVELDRAYVGAQQTGRRGATEEGRRPAPRWCSTRSSAESSRASGIGGGCRRCRQGGPQGPTQIIQEMPKRSATTPNFEEKKVLPRGICTLPPSARAANTRSAWASLGTPIAREKPWKFGCPEQ